MAAGHAIRGSRVGAGPMGETERGEAAPRVLISFWCGKGHETIASFRRGAEIPENWDCPKCGWPAGKDRENTPPRPVIQPFKTHLAYVKERRSDEEAQDILNEALENLRTDEY